MTLIKCPDCKRYISRNADTCPHCGSPIAAMRDSKPVTTTQDTSKRLKIHIIFSVFIVIVGFIWSLLTAADISQTGADISPTAVLVMTGGIIWFIVTKFRIWWHHR